MGICDEVNKSRELSMMGSLVYVGHAKALGLAPRMCLEGSVS